MITATPTSPLWFLDTAVRIRVSADEGRNRLSMLESLAPQGDSPPLHVHTRDDELFHVLSGELLLEVGGEELVLGGRGDGARPCRRRTHLPRRVGGSPLARRHA